MPKFTGNSEDVSVGAQDIADDLRQIEINAQTGTTYTLALTDAGKIVEMGNASANTLTVPPNSSIPFPVGTVVGVRQVGAGTTSVVAGTGVTLRNAWSASQWQEVSLHKRATDEWVIV